MSKRRVCRCPSCEKIVLSQHPLNPDMWIRPDGRLPMFPAGKCMFCGSEYNFEAQSALITLEELYSPGQEPKVVPEPPIIAETSKAYKKPKKRIQKAQKPKNPKKVIKAPKKPRGTAKKPAAAVSKTDSTPQPQTNT